MKGIQAVNSSNIMINVVSYILKKNVLFLWTLPTTFDLLLHISQFFFTSDYEEQKQDCAVCQLKIGMRNGDAAAKSVLFVQETLNHVVCMPAL